MAGVAGNRTNSGLAGALALAMAFMPAAAFAEPAANTNSAAPTAHTTAVTAEQARAAQPTVQPAFQVASNTTARGAPVVFEYGDGVNLELITSAIRVVTSRGCPASAVKGVVPGTVMVDTNGSGDMFTDPGAAAHWALENCRP